VQGRRIPVLTIVVRVEGRGLDPEAVADRFDLDIADVCSSLLYYHEHPDEFDAVRRERDQVMAEIEDAIDRPDGVKPPERIDAVGVFRRREPGTERF
jgi:broad-specificity NMP kinase